MEEERWCGWDKNGKEVVREDGAWKVLWRKRRRAPKWCFAICLLLCLLRRYTTRLYPSMLGQSPGLLSTPENLGEPLFPSCVWPLNCVFCVDFSRLGLWRSCFSLLFFSSFFLVFCRGCGFKRIRFFCSRPLCEISTFPLLSWAFVVCAHRSLFLSQIFSLDWFFPCAMRLEWIGSPLVTKRLGKITNLAIHTLKHLDWDTRGGFSVEFPVSWWWLETAFC